MPIATASSRTVARLYPQGANQVTPLRNGWSIRCRPQSTRHQPVRRVPGLRSVCRRNTTPVHAVTAPMNANAGKRVVSRDRWRISPCTAQAAAANAPTIQVRGMRRDAKLYVPPRMKSRAMGPAAWSTTASTSFGPSSSSSVAVRCRIAEPDQPMPQSRRYGSRYWRYRYPKTPTSSRSAHSVLRMAGTSGCTGREYQLENAVLVGGRAPTAFLAVPAGIGLRSRSRGSGSTRAPGPG